MSLLCLTTIDKIAGAWGEHYSECDGYLDLLDDFLYNQLLKDCAFSDKTDYNAKIEAMGLFFDIIQNKNLYYNSAKDYLEKCINVLENILKTENFSSWRDPILKRKSTEQFLQDMKDFLKTHKTRSTNLFDKFDEAKEPGCINVHASSEDLELSRGEIGVSIEDYDPSKDKEKSTKNRWSEKPNQNTAVIPAAYQESDNYKKDKLDKAKYTNFLGRTDQDKPVELADFALPNQPARKDETFEKYTDTIQDDQQQYDTRNFGKGNLKPTQNSNFLYKSELLHIEQGIIKEADLNSKKPYLLQQLNKANIKGDEAEKVISQINEADPTGNYARYTDWLLGQYLKGDFKLEDKDEAKELLKTFNEETQSKRLKGVNIKEKKYQDLKSILQDHLGTSDKASDKLSKELEGKGAEFLTSYTDEEIGDKYDLIRVYDADAAESLFSGTDWCVRHPETAKDYLEDGNFLLARKNGKNYLLYHNNDFKYVDDTNPTEKHKKEFSRLINSLDVSSDGDDDLYNILNLSRKVNEGFDISERDILNASDNDIYNICKYGDDISLSQARQFLTKSSIDRILQVLLDSNEKLPEWWPAGFENECADFCENAIYNSDYSPVIKDLLEDFEGNIRSTALETIVLSVEKGHGIPEKVLDYLSYNKYWDLVDRVVDKLNPQEAKQLYDYCKDEELDVDYDKLSSKFEGSEEEQQEQDINKMELLHITTIQRIAAEAKDSAGETSITPTVTDNVVDQITQKPTDNVTQGKGGGKPVKGTKRGGTGTRPVKALYSTNLKSIDIIADQFGDWTTRMELPESALKRFRGQDANEKNEKENKDLKKKMKGKPNKPLYNVPKKDVYAWGNDDLMGGAVFYSDMSLPQMGDLSEMN